jgi:hypothetical protein
MSRRQITRGGLSRDGLTSMGTAATLRRLSPHHLVLRALVLVGPMLAATATMAAHGGFQPIALVVVAVLTIGCAIWPDTHVGLLTILLIAINWIQSVEDVTTPWVVVAASGLLVFHTAMAASTIAPPAARWDRPLVALWVERSAVVIASTAATWAVSVGIDRVDVGASAPALIAALALVSAIAWWTRVRSLG